MLLGQIQKYQTVKPWKTVPKPILENVCVGTKCWVELPKPKINHPEPVRTYVKPNHFKPMENQTRTCSGSTQH